MRQLSKESSHLKKKTKEVGKILKGGLEEYGKQVKVENEKLSKNSPKSK